MIKNLQEVDKQCLQGFLLREGSTPYLLVPLQTI